MGRSQRIHNPTRGWTRSAKVIRNFRPEGTRH